MRLSERFLSISWRDLAVAAGPIVLLTVVVTWATYHFVRPAPPDTITITTGAEGSMFRTSAERYKRILARNGVALQILPSEGSLQNLQRLNDSSVNVDIGFVQGGLATAGQAEKLMSLGSVFREPLAIFYRSATPVTVLSEFSGQRLAIGMQGSGGRALTLVLLKANGIEPGGATQLLDQTGSDAADALIEHRVDAVFLAGDSASFPVMRKLRSSPGIRLFNFTQADAYTRRFPYLDKLELPMGIFDLGKNNPPETVFLIGPTVELVAREGLHPALSDLLIEAAREVHGGAGLMRRAGEFPVPLEQEFRISDDASRYYKSGKGFLYRNLPFWLATLTDRLLVLIVPILVLLIPGFRVVPWLYTWRVRSRIYRWYGDLIALERSAGANAAPQEREKLLKRLDEIEIAVNKIKTPLAFADEFYVLREHIGFVRARFADGATASAPGARSTHAS